MTQEEMWAMIEASGRKCGDCSMCCKIFKVPELDKKAGEWCKHCRPGKGGCSIHQTRPPVCRQYACLWLLRPELSDAFKPNNCKFIMDINADADGEMVLRVLIDQDNPNRWREPPYYEALRELAWSAERGELIPGHTIKVRIRSDQKPPLYGTQYVP